MATGFVQRFKGRIQAAMMFLGSGGIVDGAANTGNVLLGNANGFPTVSAADAITAHAGGGQTNAKLLTAAVNRIATVGTAADSVKLPVSAAGMEITVINDAGTNAAQVFGYGTDTIDGVATATGVALSAGHRATFICVTAGAWQSLSGTKSS